MEYSFIKLTEQKLHIKYGFDKVTYQISKACALQFYTITFFKFTPI